VIEEPQFVVHEGDEPDFIAHLLDAHVLAGEDGAQVDLALAKADTTAVGHGDAEITMVKKIDSTSCA
jgi:hypothetical protein